ncbi:DUF1367 family protein [Klebsiella pneumoniae]
MAQLHLIKQSQGILIPATPETSDFLQSKCKLGSQYLQILRCLPGVGHR